MANLDYVFIKIIINVIGLDHSPLTARDGENDFGFGSQSSTDTVQPVTITPSTPPDAGIITVTVIEQLASICHQNTYYTLNLYWY